MSERIAGLAGAETEALRNAEMHLRRIFDALPLAIGHIGRDERYIAANLGMEALLERPREEIVGCTVREVIGEEAYAETRPHVAAVLQGREVAFERRRRRADGSTLWLRVQYVPEVDAKGVRGYFALVSDISDQKRAELATRDSEARFRALTTLSSDWYWEMDEELRFTYVSEGIRRVRGVEPSSLIGKRRWDIQFVGSGEEMARHRAVMEAHQPFSNFVYARKGADGRITYASHDGEPIFDEQGRFRGYRGIARDITASIRATEALRESEERFRSLSKLSSDFYWETDAGHRFRALSDEGALKKDGTDRTVGKTAWEIPSVHPAAEGWHALKAKMDGHLPFRDFEFARHDAKGVVRWYSVIGEPVFDGQGNFTGYRGVGRDVTERKRTEQELERLAHYDKLTGLPNRVTLQDRLAQALQRARRAETLLAVMFLDLDQFKEVNDSLGHAAGDELLQSVATRLTGCVRSTDTVARLGGDEFTVLLEGMRNVEEVDLVARKILAAVAQPHSAAGRELFVSTSIGVTVYPLDDQDQETLLKNADRAMYQAKQAGRNNVQYFSHEAGARRA